MQRLEVSGATRPIYGSLGVKRLSLRFDEVLPWALGGGSDHPQKSRCAAVRPFVALRANGVTGTRVQSAVRGEPQCIQIKNTTDHTRQMKVKFTL